MALIILRCAFVLVAAGIGVSIINTPVPENVDRMSTGATLGIFLGVVAVALAVIGTDMALRNKRLDIISCVYFGIIVGLFLTYVVGIALTPLLEGATYQGPMQMVLGMVLCYSCISLLMQTKDDFRFVIPYVEFAKEVKGMKPFVLDTSVVIDGRIADVVETHIMDNQQILPRFMLLELQNIADSSDNMRRSRGRRGLDILNRLRSTDGVDLQIYDRETPDMEGQPNDMKLVLLAKTLEGKVVTGDYNLNKVAKLHNVEVINLNDLANALKPVFLPGENFTVKIVKKGEESTQGVGYLDDGTMIVIEGGRDHINQTVEISVTSVLQTSAGRMIFGRYEASQQPSETV